MNPFWGHWQGEDRMGWGNVGRWESVQSEHTRVLQFCC